MRITENRMTELAALRTAKARERVARSGDELSSGLRVLRPSDDPAAWASAQRARLRQATSESRGSAIATSNERVAATDGALASIGEILSRVKQLSIQAANSTVSGEGRQAIAQEVRALAGSVLAAANSTGNDGQFLFAGSRGDNAPFDISGAYVGDTIDADIESAAGNLQQISVNGSVLTAASGVNVLGELDSFATALEANDIAGIEAAVGTLDTAITQVNRARSSVGAMNASLDLADVARTELEHRLTETVARSVEIDAISAASDLAGATQALEVSSAVTQMIIDVTRAL